MQKIRIITVFVVGTLKPSSSKEKRILSANFHIVFVLQDSIKLERLCKHEGSRKSVMADSGSKDISLALWHGCTDKTYVITVYKD